MKFELSREEISSCQVVSSLKLLREIDKGISKQMHIYRSMCDLHFDVSTVVFTLLLQCKFKGSLINKLIQSANTDGVTDKREKISRIYTNHSSFG